MFEVLVWLETWKILQIGYDSLNFDMLACIWANKSVRNTKFFISYLWTISPYTSHCVQASQAKLAQFRSLYVSVFL